ncbi:MAG: hypothetical protein H7Y38_07340 [Armatimonadetes bacterium]|nr:hypothetical protein [Armatimonadota bacterium]
MRIILKPAGIVLMLIAITIPVLLAVINRRTSGVTGTTQVASAMPAPHGELAKNPGFEDGYTPVVPYSNVGKPVGQTAISWHDDSSWARVEVVYSQDTTRFHSGLSSQKIEVKKVVRGATDADAVQFVQNVNLTVGKTYQSAIWVCAEKPVEVEYALRQANGDYTYNGTKTVTADSEWQRISLECPIISKDGDTYLFVRVKTPGTIWLDDATCVEK